MKALEHAYYAVKVGPDLWMSFDTNDPEWTAARFAEHDLGAKDPE